MYVKYIYSDGWMDGWMARILLQRYQRDIKEISNRTLVYV